MQQQRHAICSMTIYMLYEVTTSSAHLSNAKIQNWSPSYASCQNSLIIMLLSYHCRHKGFSLNFQHHQTVQWEIEQLNTVVVAFSFPWVCDAQKEDGHPGAAVLQTMHEGHIRVYSFHLEGFGPVVWVPGLCLTLHWMVAQWNHSLVARANCWQSCCHGISFYLCLCFFLFVTDVVDSDKFIF